jgi:hypothetical protein
MIINIVAKLPTRPNSDVIWDWPKLCLRRRRRHTPDRQSDEGQDAEAMRNTSKSSQR